MFTTLINYVIPYTHDLYDLHLINPRWRTQKISEIAVEKDPWCLQHVPRTIHYTENV